MLNSETETSGVVLGSLLDLVIIAPILFLAWKRQKSVKKFVLLMASGLILARFLIPLSYLEPFVVVTWVGFGVEAGLLLLEILLLVTLVRFMPKIVRETKSSTLPVIFAFQDAVNRFVQKHPLIQIVCSELLMFYYAFGSWRKKPIYNKNTFTLHANSSYIAFQVMLIHAIVVETLGIHWWLHSKSMLLSLILLLINIYSLVFVLADIQVVRLNPLHINEKGFYISLGLAKRMEVRWEDIEEVITDKKVLHQKLSKDSIEFIARDFEKVFPDFILKLKEPKMATLFLGTTKSYQKVAIKLDDPQNFYDILQENLTAKK